MSSESKAGDIICTVHWNRKIAVVSSFKYGNSQMLSILVRPR